MAQALTNWAANQRFSAREVLHPASVDEVQSAVRGRDGIKVLGTRHSFNGIADTEHTILVLDALPAEITLAPATATVRAAAGVTFGALGAFLHERGFALPNLASLPHISLAGAYATGTHGSGMANPVLAASVAGLEIVKADGELLKLSRAADPEVFDGVAVGLGALGVIVSVTLDVVPDFAVRQDVYLDLAADVALPHFDAIMATAYSVSLFTDWKQKAFDTVWCKSRVGEPSRREHFRMDFLPSHGDELQTE